MANGPPHDMGEQGLRSPMAYDDGPTARDVCQAVCRSRIALRARRSFAANAPRTDARSLRRVGRETPRQGAALRGEVDVERGAAERALVDGELALVLLDDLARQHQAEASAGR